MPHVAYFKPYKRINQLIQNESFEPMISWGVRMALSGTLPIIWGLATGRISDAIWITLTAEGICWVELKGSFSWRVRTLLTGAILALLCSALGLVTGGNIWLSVVAMFAIAFVATLLKDMGDRASGLAICVYLMFIICNAYPATGWHQAHHRMALIALGALWPVIVGIGASFLMPAEEPFRRHIALIYRSIATLVSTVSASGTDKARGDVYKNENAVRTAIDNSYTFYGRMAHAVDEKDHQKYQLTLLRKIAGMVAVNVTAMGEEMNHIAVPELDERLRVKAATLFSALKEAVSRISVFIITLKAEEKLLARTQINRLTKLTALIREYPLPYDAKQVSAINRILQLTDRTVRLLENAILRLDTMGKDERVYHSYSFIKTLFLLKPKYFLNSMRVLFSINSFTTRYAIRSAVAATLALFLYKWLHIDHGYWLPFSVMIVIQPYFGATFRKARDRIIGTLLGGIAGGLLLHTPAGLHAKELFLFLTFTMMVYYVRKQYAIAAFAITLNLVLLFNLDSSYNNMLLVTRALCTIGGALLAVLSGVALLPTWDEKLLPSHLAAAIKGNYDYFIATFYTPERTLNWTRYKRPAESANSNAFDSFNRYVQEPGKKQPELYYGLITCNVRITRNLNNIHLEQDEKKLSAKEAASTSQQKKIVECHALFEKVLTQTALLRGRTIIPVHHPADQFHTPMQLNEVQIIALEKLIIELKAMLQDFEQLGKSA